MEYVLLAMNAKLPTSTNGGYNYTSRGRGIMRPRMVVFSRKDGGDSNVKLNILNFLAFYNLKNGVLQQIFSINDKNG